MLRGCFFVVWCPFSQRVTLLCFVNDCAKHLSFYYSDIFKYITQCNVAFYDLIKKQNKIHFDRYPQVSVCGPQFEEAKYNDATNTMQYNSLLTV